MCISFTNRSSLKPPSHPVGYLPFYRWENWDSEQLSDLTKVMQLGSPPAYLPASLTLGEVPGVNPYWKGSLRGRMGRRTYCSWVSCVACKESLLGPWLRSISRPMLIRESDGIWGGKTRSSWTRWRWGVRDQQGGLLLRKQGLPPSSS